MKVHVHLGAHKTATTFLQSQIKQNRGKLAASGVFSPEQKHFQDNFGRYFNAALAVPAPFAMAARPFLRRRLNRYLQSEGPASAAILSDENLAGMLAFNHRQGGLYRRVGARASMLASILDGHDAHFYFAIRSYKNYLPSAYLQLASNGREPDYDDYLASLDVAHHGWSEAVGAIAAAVGPERLTVWTYEWFSRRSAKVFDLLAPGIPLDLEVDESRRVVLPSMTLKGLRVMQALDGKLSKPELARMGKMMRRFAFDEPNPRLGIEDEKMIERLDGIYENDLVRIRDLGVRLYGGRRDDA